MPLQPPVPFADFEFTFDPSLSSLFPNPPPLPSSADLFSPSETNDLLGFLDNFGDFAWDVPSDLAPHYDHVSSTYAPYSNPHLNTVPDPSTSNRPRAANRTASARGTYQEQDDPLQIQFDVRGTSQARSTTSESSTTTNADPPPRSAVANRNKPLLSTPQKRLNHIMSEQRRRNAIRDGYAQLIALMAPAGSTRRVARIRESLSPSPDDVIYFFTCLLLPSHHHPSHGRSPSCTYASMTSSMKAPTSSSAPSPPRLPSERLSWPASNGSTPQRQSPGRMHLPVKQILLVLRPMDGVAYTFGTQSHKEIHFSLDHIKRSAKRARDEIMGVLVHEVVHCYQYNALDSCPGGLIEGIADFVRLHEGLAPPHWKRTAGDKWDAGYEKTAYFLDWIENRYGDGTIRELNECMKENQYHRRVFKELTGRPVRKLWTIYCKILEDGGDTDDYGALSKKGASTIATH
ncbi:hypothetical protein CVT26_002178 [Gymnopilus dilepis]|uniref:BHLH domain-containing protein n=1 Tax=Gymnopilus dilepis TaxID=231916 RepID=A0A409VDS5_9AGAR|nr:hypothetical protein CVT26_002178 [Gymnopilus dilepis]